MKQTRMRSSLWVLALIAVVLSISFVIVQTQCNAMQTALSAVTNAEQDKPDTVPQAIAALEAQWDKSIGLLRFVLPNQSLAEMQAIVVRLRPLAEADSDELSAELATLSALVDWMFARFTGCSFAHASQ